MSKCSPHIVLTIPAAALAALLGVTSAAAATTWTVRPGGPVTAQSGQVVIKDASTGSLVECPSSTLKATLKSGTGLSGTGIGSVSSFTVATCTGPLGVTFSLTLSDLPYGLDAQSYDPGTGTTTGDLTGIHGRFTGPGCIYVLDGTGASMDDGTVTVTYVNGTHKLDLLPAGGNLHVYKLQGCGFLGGIHDGDHITISTTATVIPAQSITGS